MGDFKGFSATLASPAPHGKQGRYAELAQIYKKSILTALSDTENALIAIAETSLQLKY
jgi:hypothetical protein